MTDTAKTLDVLRRIRNKVCKGCCVWCDWRDLGSDKAAGRHMTEAFGERTGISTQDARAAIHEAMRRALAEGREA